MVARWLNGVVSSGGGGAGGYRASGYGPSPLQGSAQELGLGTYAVTVGAGGAAQLLLYITVEQMDQFSICTITSAGGGKGGKYNTAGSPGGSRWWSNRSDLVWWIR